MCWAVVVGVGGIQENDDGGGVDAMRKTPLRPERWAPSLQLGSGCSRDQTTPKRLPARKEKKRKKATPAMVRFTILVVIYI